MPENRVQIEDATGHRVSISPDGRFLTSVVPETYQFYFHTIFDAPGVVAANNFMSIFNPVGSGKIISFFQAEIQNYAIGAASTAASMQAVRITAASAGTQIAANAISRFITTQVDPKAEVRIGNPTVTVVGNTLNAWAPPISVGTGSGSTAATATPPGEGFYCLPGEGLVFRTASGDTTQRWKINTIWAEF